MEISEGSQPMAFHSLAILNTPTPPENLYSIVREIIHIYSYAVKLLTFINGLKKRIS